MGPCVHALHAPEAEHEYRGGERQYTHHDGDHTERPLRCSAEATDRNRDEELGEGAWGRAGQEEGG